MTFNYKEALPQDFHPSSKVWIYQASRLFTMHEALQIETVLENFVMNWKSHGAAVKGFANLFFGRFLIFIADETATGISGCGTDSSVKIVKQFEDTFKVNMFERQQLAFLIKDKVEILPLAQINYAIENGFINANTLFFNNLVSTLEVLQNNWISPISETWLHTKFLAVSK